MSNASNLPEGLVIMDLNAIPHNSMDIEQWSYLIRQQGVCFYDSEEGETPQITNINSEIQLVDMNNEAQLQEFEGLQSQIDQVNRYTVGYDPIISDSTSFVGYSDSTPGIDGQPITDIGDSDFQVGDVHWNVGRRIGTLVEEPVIPLSEDINAAAEYQREYNRIHAKLLETMDFLEVEEVLIQNKKEAQEKSQNLRDELLQKNKHLYKKQMK